MTITNSVPPADATPIAAAPAARPTPITGIGHVAVNTADLARFRRFYEQILGIPLGVIMRMPVAPHLRHAFFPVAPGVILHVFEVPGYDPRAQGIGADIGERGRVDHFAFLVDDEAALEGVASRLRAAGASDGVIRDFGVVLSVHATDPDGLQFEVTCTNLSYDPDAASEEVEEIGIPDWFSMVSAPTRG